MLYCISIIPIFIYIIVLLGLDSFYIVKKYLLAFVITSGAISCVLAFALLNSIGLLRVVEPHHIRRTRNLAAFGKVLQDTRDFIVHAHPRIKRRHVRRYFFYFVFTKRART